MMKNYQIQETEGKVRDKMEEIDNIMKKNQGEVPGDYFPTLVDFLKELLEAPVQGLDNSSLLKMLVHLTKYTDSEKTTEVEVSYQALKLVFFFLLNKPQIVF